MIRRLGGPRVGLDAGKKDIFLPLQEIIPRCPDSCPPFFIVTAVETLNVT
jgi:hypothetical protein